MLSTNDEKAIKFIFTAEIKNSEEIRIFNKFFESKTPTKPIVKSNNDNIK